MDGNRPTRSRIPMPRSCSAIPSKIPCSTKRTPVNSNQLNSTSNLEDVKKLSLSSKIAKSVPVKSKPPLNMTTIMPPASTIKKLKSNVATKVQNNLNTTTELPATKKSATRMSINPSRNSATRETNFKVKSSQMTNKKIPLKDASSHLNTTHRSNNFDKKVTNHKAKRSSIIPDKNQGSKPPLAVKKRKIPEKTPTKSVSSNEVKSRTTKSIKRMSLAPVAVELQKKNVDKQCLNSTFDYKEIVASTPLKRQVDSTPSEPLNSTFDCKVIEPVGKNLPSEPLNSTFNCKVNEPVEENLPSEPLNSTFDCKVNEPPEKNLLSEPLNSTFNCKVNEPLENNQKIILNQTMELNEPLVSPPTASPINGIPFSDSSDNNQHVQPAPKALNETIQIDVKPEIADISYKLSVVNKTVEVNEPATTNDPHGSLLSFSQSYQAQNLLDVTQDKHILNLSFIDKMKPVENLWDLSFPESLCPPDEVDDSLNNELLTKLAKSELLTIKPLTSSPLTAVDPDFDFSPIETAASEKFKDVA